MNNKLINEVPQGFRQPKTMNKRELGKKAGDLENRLSVLEQGVSKTLIDLQRGMLGQLQTLSQNIANIDYRSLGLCRVLIAKGVLTEDEVESMATELQIADFMRQSDAEDRAQNLTKPDPTYTANNGDWVIFGSKSKYGQSITIFTINPETNLEDIKVNPNPLAGQDFPPFNILRNKSCLGLGQLPKSMNDALVGAKVGDIVKCNFEITRGVPVDVELVVYGIRVAPKADPIIVPTTMPVDGSKMENTEATLREGNFEKLVEETTNAQ